MTAGVALLFAVPMVQVFLLIRKTLVPMIYYVLAAGTLGMAIITMGLNGWYLLWLLVVSGFVYFIYVNRGLR